MTLSEKRDRLIAYLQMKVEAQDWHAVADAACDLRELEVEIRFAVNPQIVQVGTGPFIQR